MMANGGMIYNMVKALKYLKTGPSTKGNSIKVKSMEKVITFGRMGPLMWVTGKKIR